MAIPDYGLKDSDGNHILSRDPRFNHPWISSKLFDHYDNDTHDQMCIPRQARSGEVVLPDILVIPRGRGSQSDNPSPILV